MEKINDKLYIVYITVNNNNFKLYAGVHTQIGNEFDGYIGCGISSKDSKILLHPKTPFHYAVKKHGYKAFRRHDLQICNTEAEAYELEKKIVNSEWIKRDDVYNATLGGKGGWSHIRLQVLQYSNKGKFIKEYASVSDAAMYTKKASRTEIARSCKNLGLYTSGGYYWDYKISDDIQQHIKIRPKNNVNSKKVLQYSKYGEFLNEFQSMRVAAKFTKANGSEISIACKNWARKSGGFYWRFKNGNKVPDTIDIPSL